MNLSGPPPPTDVVQGYQVGRPYLVAGALAFIGGCVWVSLDSIAWYYAQQYIAVYDQQSILGTVLRYYLAEALAILVVAAGAYLMYRGARRNPGVEESDSIESIIADSLRSRSDLKIGVAAAILNGMAYLVISSILVYQPTVDFASAYGVTSPGWSAAACCGSPGTVPVLIVYLLPQAHIGLQILPLDALFAAVLPLLVGFNVVVAAHALRNKALRGNTGLLSSLGVLGGLFTGCPTCAGLFLAGTLGGLGATGLAVALAPYQLFFVVISIPLLAISPLVIAYNARRAMRAACPFPAAS